MINNSPMSFKHRVLNHFNSILDSSIPQAYKHSLVLPILKPKKPKTDIKSYRPISLNACLAKTLDKIIAKRLWWFVLNNNLINSNQIGFRRGRSVIDSLLLVDHIATRSLSLKKHVTLISLDFNKAFDKIGIHSVINQLKEWKIGKRILNYVLNFMTNRKIIIKSGNNLSSLFPLNNGIPQGSPISVILFLIAYNTLSHIISLHKEIKLTAYADDFHLIIEHNKQKNPTTNLQTLFSQIDDWCTYSGSILSKEKCQVLHICRKHNCSAKTLTGDTNLPSTNSLRILRLFTDILPNPN